MLVTLGNKKMGKDTLIMNICSAHNCPSRKLGLCQIPKHRCYAYKDEIRYPHALLFRNRQEGQWDEMSPFEIATELGKIKSRRKSLVEYLRLSESGDFRSQADVDKASEIAEHLKAYTIKMYCYTARSDLSFKKKSNNMTVNGSGFMVDNMFKVVPQGTTIKSGQYVCPGDCRKCELCKYSTKATILTPLRNR